MCQKVEGSLATIVKEETLERLIVYAVLQKDVDKFDLLVADGANVLWRNEFAGGSLLHLLCDNDFSCTEGAKQMIKKLIQANAAIVFMCNDQGESALDVCAKNGYVACARAILESVGKDIQLLLLNGKGNGIKATPLYYAVQSACYRMVCLLLANGSYKKEVMEDSKKPMALLSACHEHCIFYGDDPAHDCCCSLCYDTMAIRVLLLSDDIPEPVLNLFRVENKFE